MKDFKLGLPFKKANETSEVTKGNVMEGYFTNLSTHEQYEFQTDFVYRDSQYGTFRLHGAMIDPRDPEREVGIGFTLVSKDSPSAQYLWNDSALKDLFFMEHPTTYYLAEDGYINLVIDASEVRVIGRMTFTAGNYKVNVFFNKTGMD